jgi:very-short-patch-repair endonuclease
VHTSRRLPRRDVAYRHNLPITAPARTLIDLAEVADAAVLERAVETAFAKRRVNERQLRAVVARTPGRRGGRRLTALLDYRGDSGFTRSWAEDRLRRILRPTDLPQPKSNDRVAGYEVDFHFVGHGVIVEVDSWRYHSGQADFARDRRKWAHLRASGYEVVGVTAHELEHQPEAAIARIATALALASQR